MTRARATLHDRDKLFVEAEFNRTGDLVLCGQDLNGAEYEYTQTISASDIPQLVAALGGEEGADVLDLLQQHAETIVSVGERTWLIDHDIPFEPWSNNDMDFG